MDAMKHLSHKPCARQVASPLGQSRHHKLKLEKIQLMGGKTYETKTVFKLLY